MHDLIYALRFTGKAEPVGTVGNVLRATTTAPSVSLISSIGPSGLAGTFSPAPGAAATFAPEVTFTSDTEFQEVETTTFGAGNVLHFSTVESGYFAPSADPARQHSVVAWRIDWGEGQFAGATGLITSNFFVDDQWGVVDHHFGVLHLPS